MPKYTDEHILSTIESALRAFGVTQTEPITPATSFVGDLGMDSLDQIELVMNIEDMFEIEIPDDDIEAIKTVGELITYLKDTHLL